MRFGCVVLVASLQAEHKFLRQPAGSQEAADKVLTDAGREQQEISRFFDEVKSSTSTLSSELQQANARIAELAEQDKQSKAELEHAKQAFKQQIKQVEVKLVEKVHAVEADNAGLKNELSRANLNVQLHSKAEQDLKARLQEMGRVFSNQEQTVKSILTESSNVAQALKAQDQAKAVAQDAEEDVEQEPVEAPEELSLPKVEEEEPKDEPAPVAAVKAEPKAAEPKAEPKAEVAKAEEVKAEPQVEVEAKEEKSPLDSLASEVDTLASEADSKPAPAPAKAHGFAGVASEQKAELQQAEQPSSADLLDGANDELTSLLKE